MDAPYSPLALDLLSRNNCQWNPTCPMCRTAVRSEPKEVRMLSELAGIIRTTAEDEGVYDRSKQLREAARENRITVWDSFFDLQYELEHKQSRRGY